MDPEGTESSRLMSSEFSPEKWCDWEYSGLDSLADADWREDAFMSSGDCEVCSGLWGVCSAGAWVWRCGSEINHGERHWCACSIIQHTKITKNNHPRPWTWIFNFRTDHRRWAVTRSSTRPIIDVGSHRYPNGGTYTCRRLLFTPLSLLGDLLKEISPFIFFLFFLLTVSLHLISSSSVRFFFEVDLWQRNSGSSGSDSTVKSICLPWSLDVSTSVRSIWPRLREW